MNRKPDTHTNLLSPGHRRVCDDARRADERGYTLVALLALMSILALAMSAAAPRIRQQVQRSLEKEAIARGQEVAEAIHEYRVANGGNFPSSMEQLLEGKKVGIKTVQILRASAARDPLSKSGEWKVVRANDRVWIEFQESLARYVNGVALTTLIRPDYATVPHGVRNITGLAEPTKEKGDCEENTEPNGTGPFIGVVSRSGCSSVLTYYGIDRHDRWVFTPVFR